MAQKIQEMIRYLRQRFANKGNACYMNATVQSLQWLMHVSAQGTNIMGAGEAFFTFLRDAGDSVDLMQVQQWRELITGWAEAHRQHDIGEFMGYFLTKPARHSCRGDGKHDASRTRGEQLAAWTRGMGPRH